MRVVLAEGWGGCRNFLKNTAMKFAESISHGSDYEDGNLTVLDRSP
jgi:hypothetical protein